MKKNYYLYILLLPLFTLSVLSINIAGLNIRTLDFSIVILSMIVAIRLAIKNHSLRLIKIDLIQISTLFHLLLLFIIPTVGFFAYGILDISLTLRWLQIFLISLIIFSFKIRIDEKDLASIFLISGSINLIYSILSIVENKGIIPYGSLPHHLVSDSLGWKVSDRTRIPALFVGPNQLGWYALPVVLYSMAFFFSSNNKKRKWFIILIIHLFLLVISTARTAIFAAIISIFSFWFLIFIREFVNSKTKKPTLHFPLIILLISSLIYIIGILFEIFRFIGIERAIKAILGNTAADKSFATRLNYWDGAISTYIEQFYPFGTLTTPTDYTGVIDSGWISYLIQSGPILIFSFSTMILITSIISFYFYWVYNNRIALSLLLYSITLSIGQITLSPFHYLPTLILFILLIVISKQHQIKIMHCIKR